MNEHQDRRQFVLNLLSGLLGTSAAGGIVASGLVALHRVGETGSQTSNFDERVRRVQEENPGGELPPGDQLAWVNSAFRNGGGFRNTAFRNGGFRNTGFRNGGWVNGWRNTGAWRNYY